MASGVSGMRLGAAAVAAASQSAESRDPPAGRLRKAWRILRMLYRNDVTRYTVCKVTEGVSGVSGHAADFLLFSKRTATGPSCGKSIHVPHLRALRGCSLVSKLLKSRKSAVCPETPPVRKLPPLP